MVRLLRVLVLMMFVVKLLPVIGQDVELVSMPLFRLDGVTVEPFLTAARLKPAPDPCHLSEVVATPTRPNWNTSTTTTQCGVVEVDFGWQRQTMTVGVAQHLLTPSLRYGLSPRIDLRWCSALWMHQAGDATATLDGMGDQYLSVRYRLTDQEKTRVSLALSYGYKFATADAQKGFGSAYGDHELTLIASRDLGKLHLDSNLVGTLAGSENGYESSVQQGVAFSHPVTTKLAVVLESYGGSQAGTPDRMGANLVGANYAFTPRVVLDGAYARAYTAGVPRSQLTFGITIAHRAHLPVWSRVNKSGTVRF